MTGQDGLAPGYSFELPPEDVLVLVAAGAAAGAVDVDSLAGVTFVSEWVSPEDDDEEALSLLPDGFVDE